MPEINTGMERAFAKRLLTLSKQEPINVAVAQAAEPGFALFLADKIKQPRAVEKQLLSDFPAAKNSRFGTARVSEDEPKLVRFTLNKAASGMAKRLLKTLKGTGFTKVTLLLEDGSSFDSAADEEEVVPQTAGLEAQAPPQTAGLEPQAASKPALDAAQLTKMLSQLIGRIAEAAGTDAVRKAALTKLAVEAGGALKAANLPTAEQGLQALKEALETAPTAPAAEQIGAQTAVDPAKGAVAYAKSCLAWRATRARTRSDIDKLSAELQAVFGDDDDIAKELEQKYRSCVAPILEELDDGLADKLDEAANASDPTARKKLVEEARSLIGKYQSFLAANDIIARLDSNPLVPLAIQHTLSSTLDAVAKAVR